MFGLTEELLLRQYKFYKKLLLLRNHGLIDRDTVKINGFNSDWTLSSCCWKLAHLPKAKILQNKELEMQIL